MKYDILAINEKSSSVKVEANEITSIKNSDIVRYGVRRFENGKQFQTSRLGEASTDRLITDTKEWGGPGIPHEYGFAPAHEESRAGSDVGFEQLAEFENCAMELVRKHPQFVFTGRCAVTSGSVALTSNYGVNLKTSGGLCDWYLTYQRKGSGNMMDGWLFESTAKPNVRREFEAHGEFLEAQMHEAKLTGGRMPVLMVEALAPLAKLRQSLAINRYREGTCLHAGKLGEQLFSPKFTLIDRAYIPDAGVNQFFDGEGVVRANDDYALIEKGRFIGLLSDLRFGKKFGAPSTGNGVRAYNGGVTLASRSLCIAKGEQPWREIVKGLDRCLVAVVTAGGDSNDLGEFSSPVQLGYVFEKGKLVGRAPQVTVKSALNDYLGKNLVAVARDNFVACSPSASLISEMDVMVN